MSLRSFLKLNTTTSFESEPYTWLKFKLKSYCNCHSHSQNLGRRSYFFINGPDLVDLSGNLKQCL